MAYIPFPPGTILPFAGTTAPDGWLLCDGSAISRTTYAALFGVLSTNYDTQFNEVTGTNWTAPAITDFRVPDYRASFLRGVGTASGKDATTLGGRQGEKTKTPATAFSLTGTAAVTSNTTLTQHTHTMNDPGHTHALGVTLGQGNAFTDNSITFAGAVQTSNAPFTRNDGPSIYKTGSWMQGTATGASPNQSNIDHSHSVSGSVNGGGDNETRPMNKGVNYIIKF